jgi:hypothetical protein
MKHEHVPEHYSMRNFIPLIVIFSVIIAFVVIKQWYQGYQFHAAMYDFMAAFFIIFGGFKIINLQGFAQAYSIYDIIAQRIPLYAYIYPFLELGLGFLYITRVFLFYANIVTIILMTISAVGVALELRKKRTIICACLGVVFKIPMTYVTLLEDVLMAIMAMLMLTF